MVQCFSSFSTHLKNISQIGSFPQVGLKIKHIWNHHQVLNLIQHFVSTDQVWLSAFCILKYILKWEICTSLCFISSPKKGATVNAHWWQLCRTRWLPGGHGAATTTKTRFTSFNRNNTKTMQFQHNETSMKFSSLSSLSYSFHRW